MKRNHLKVIQKRREKKSNYPNRPGLHRRGLFDQMQQAAPVQADLGQYLSGIPDMKVGLFDSHWVGGIFPEISEETGELKLLVEYYDDTAHRSSGIRLPGGSQEGIETPVETFLREMRQEVAMSPRAWFMHVRQTPVVRSSREHSYGKPGQHVKFGILVNASDGPIRQELLVEPDGVTLGPPYFEEVVQILLALTQDRGNKARFHAFLVYEALKLIASLNGAVARRYEKVIERFSFIRFPNGNR